MNRAVGQEFRSPPHPSLASWPSAGDVSVGDEGKGGEGEGRRQARVRLLGRLKRLILFWFVD
jgi:hypothetical protein